MELEPAVVLLILPRWENIPSHLTTSLLIHQPLIGGAIRGQASDLEIHAKDIIELKKKMHRLYAERTGFPVDRFVDLMERDRWVDPKEAIELGLISKIITSRKELDAIVKSNS